MVENVDLKMNYIAVSIQYAILCWSEK